MSKKYPLVVITIIIALGLGCSSPSGKLRFPAVYLDMDGTTLDSHHQPRPATIEVLERYRRCGGKVGIVTGRNYAMVESYLGVVKPDLPLVLYNGALTLSPLGKEVLFKAALEKEVVDQALEFASHKGVRGLGDRAPGDEGGV